MAVQEVVAARGSVASRAPVIAVEGLKKHFPVKKGLLRRTAGYVYAVDSVSFSVGEGETLGLVGESGCGKSTTGLAVLRMLPVTSGRIVFEGDDITHLSAGEMRPIQGTPFDFTKPKALGKDLSAAGGEPMGYDLNYVITPGRKWPSLVNRVTWGEPAIISSLRASLSVGAKSVRRPE